MSEEIKNEATEETKVKSKKAPIFIGVIAIIAVLAILAAIFIPKLLNKNSNGSQITLTIDVIHADGSKNTINVNTEAANLGDALTADNIITGEESEYGLFITTVDGETADSAKEEWWSITKDGEMLQTGADSTPIADNEHYEFTFTVGYDNY